jgi:GGDEF domain-containing protein
VYEICYAKVALDLFFWPAKEANYQGVCYKRMNIAKKIMLGYGALLVVVFMHLIYSLSSLEQMDRINEAITRVNNPIIEGADRLAETLLGQDLYAHRLAILKDKDSFELLQFKIKDFDQLVDEIGSINSPFAAVKELVAKGTAFRAVLDRSYGSMESALALSPEQKHSIEKELEEVIDVSRRVSFEVRHDQNVKSELSSKIGHSAYRVLLVVGVGSVFVAVGITLLFARSISRAVGQLKLSTRQISESKFNEVRYLESGDEFGEVSRSIAEMARKIEHLEKLYIATNPLSLLPGGLAIDDTIGLRLDSGRSTAVCVIDLDNFKVFNDRYGYAKGNEVIQATAAIITSAVKERGAADDFIGHIGGDDFLVVTEPERYEEICKTIIKRFDEQIPLLYDSEDRQRGAIVGKNRQGAEVVYPLMTISIAVVTDRDGSIKKPHILSKRAAELKEYVKSLAGSVYVVDKRQYSSEEDA